MQELKCPVCGSLLEVTHSERYESLCEHVSDEKPSIKEGYQCSNKECESIALGAAWTDDGELYINKDLPTSTSKLSWSECYDKMRELSCGNYHALGSFQYYYQIGNDKVKAKTKDIIVFKKWRFEFVPKTYGYEYPIEKRYLPRPLSYRFSMYKKTSDIGWSYVTSVFKKIAWKISEFKEDFSKVKTSIDEGKNPSMWNTRRLKERIYGLQSHSKEKSKNFYDRLSSKIIRVFYSKEVLQAIEIFKKLNM